MEDVSQEMKDEMRYDMMQEAKEESSRENKMYDNLDYCLEQTDAEEAVRLLKRAAVTCAKYGHIISINEILDSY